MAISIEILLGFLNTHILSIVQTCQSGIVRLSVRVLAFKRLKLRELWVARPMRGEGTTGVHFSAFTVPSGERCIRLARMSSSSRNLPHAKGGKIRKIPCSFEIEGRSEGIFDQENRK
jgi:hypothetical protein